GIAAIPAPAIASVRSTPMALARTREGMSGASLSSPRASFSDFTAEYCPPACTMRCFDKSRGSRTRELPAEVFWARIDSARYGDQMAGDQRGTRQCAHADRRVEALTNEIDTARCNVEVERHAAVCVEELGEHVTEKVLAKFYGHGQ